MIILKSVLFFSLVGYFLYTQIYFRLYRFSYNSILIAVISLILFGWNLTTPNHRYYFWALVGVSCLNIYYIIRRDGFPPLKPNPISAASILSTITISTSVLPAIFACILYFGNRRDAGYKVLITNYINLIGLMGFCYIVIYITYILLGERPAEMRSIFFLNKNYFAICCALAILLIAARNKLDVRAIVIFAALTISNAFTAQLALLMAIAMYIIINKLNGQGNNRLLLIYLVGAIISTMFTLFFRFPSIISSLNSRINIFLFNLKLDSIDIFGHELKVSSQMENYSSHNAALTVYIQHDYYGFFLFNFIILMVIISNYRMRANSRARFNLALATLFIIFVSAHPLGSLPFCLTIFFLLDTGGKSDVRLLRSI